MRHLLRNSILVVGLLVLMAASIYPPSTKLRLGKDLRGGVTLVYPVRIERSENASEILDRTISVLKQRIDPNGLLEIRMVAQGNDRIEVTMPLPGPEAVALRRAFEAELDRLGDQYVRADEFERVLRLPEGPEREAAMTSLAAGRPERAERLAAAARALDDARRARETLRAAEQSGAPDDLQLQLAEQAAQAELDYEANRNELLATVLDPEALRRALQLPATRKRVDTAGGEIVELPSARERAVEEIRADHADMLESIDRVVGAYDVYFANRRSLDDAEDLKRLRAGAGVLSFRITVSPQGRPRNTHPEEARLRQELQEKGPRNVQSRDAGWYPLNRIDNWFRSQAALDFLLENPSAYFATYGDGYVVEEYQGQYYMLCWDTRSARLTQDDGNWAVASAFPTSDQEGLPAIGFNMDPRGARLLGELTGPHVGLPMAILLDDQIYTAPNLLGQISANGQITGEFSQEEISYVVRTLSAGSLQARLAPEPISENTVAPDLGADNLRLGLRSGVVALVVVSAFMIFYYFTYGVVAVLALLANALLLVGAMALARAAFSLPGIAGIILTFGMAVDANVLIYERVREELRAGRDLRVALKLGYEKALSSIVDGNVTNLIVCVVLAYTATAEIKGFAITLGIGVVTTMFSALLISRLLFTLLVDHLNVRKMSMLPLAVPAIERLLHPKIDWIGLRPVFIIVSLAYVSLGVGMIATQGSDMLDTEFRGGTTVQMPFRRANPDDPASPRLQSTRAEIQARVQAIAEGRSPDDPLSALRAANVVPLNPEDDGVTSDTFQIKTYATDADAVLEAVIAALPDLADARPALSFRASDEPIASAAPVFPVLTPRLAEALGRPEFRGDVPAFVGGAAILLEHLDPPPTLENLRSRLAQMRGKPDFSDTLGRTVEVRILEGDQTAIRNAVVLIADENLGYFENEEAWNADVRDREWRLTREALTQAVTLASVQSFSAVIAESFRAQAVVAVALSFLLILIYIWVRFGSARYSIAAIIALIHDVLTAIGLIALSEIVYETHVLEGFAAAIGIEPFKIDLNLVAAMLTIVGYSLNDTIIILDRVREIRGKLPYASRETINTAINQTISRTAITSGTTLLAVIILYVMGGPGVHAFSFALLVGILVGTYSSVAVAAPLVWSGKSEKAHRIARKPSPSA